MVNNRLYINGQPAEYDPLDRATIDEIAQPERAMHDYAAETLGNEKHPVMSTPAIPAMRTFGPIKVPAASIS